MSRELLRATDLVVRFPAGGLSRWIVPVDRVSLTVDEGEAVAIVGESGSGKTTLGRALVRTLRLSQGQILLKNKDVSRLRGRALKQYRAAVQMVFQDPFASLNPSRTVSQQIGVPIRFHRRLTGREAHAEINQLLEQVGLTPAEDMREKYPHQLSGGQRQRVAIARALAANPQMIVADEPVSMLDVSIRAGILQLLSQLKQDLGISFVFITHDLASARYFSGRIGVMYAGQLVELGPAAQVVAEPLHPYTRLLLAASPGSGIKTALPETSQRAPDLSIGRVGCPFAPRCPLVEAKCTASAIPIQWIADRAVACVQVR